MIRFIVLTTIALTVMSGAADAAKTMTVARAAVSNRHTCEPGRVFTCDGHRACKCS